MRQALVMLLALFLFGCTQQQRAKNFGGTGTVKLDPGQKLVVATWKDDNLWLLTRPMNEGEHAETYTFKENSSFGMLEGKIILIETE